jgi:hypothetical protein
MADLRLGYRHGTRDPRLLPVDASTSAISIGQFVTLGTAGYIQRAAAGDEPYGVAMQACSAPSTDGGTSILVDVSQDSVYAVAPDEGSVTAALLFKTCDVGGAQSANIDAGTDDSLYIVGVDTAENLVFVQIRPTPASVD